MTAAGVPVSDQPFTRTGLLGFVGPVSVGEPSGTLLCPESQLFSGAPKCSRVLCQSRMLLPLHASGMYRWESGGFSPQFLILFSFQDYLVFVVGKLDGLMTVSGRRHNADDVVATALAVEPMKFVYRGR